MGGWVLGKTGFQGKMKSLVEFGSVRGFKSFLGAHISVPWMGRPHSTMCRVVGQHLLAGLNHSGFLGQLCHILGSSENWKAILQTLPLNMEMPETFQPGCRSLQPQLGILFFKDRKVGKSLKCKRAQFSCFSHPQMMAFQVWGMLSSCKPHFCQSFHFW